MAGENERLLMPYPEAMAMLGGISRTKTWELVRDGELVSVRIGARASLPRKVLPNTSIGSPRPPRHDSR